MLIEVLGRPVRMVAGRAGEHKFRWSAKVSPASKTGRALEILRKWAQRIRQRDSSVRSGALTLSSWLSYTISGKSSAGHDGCHC